ncbi:GPI inositol-deacylase-like [Tropilaelaps mercedesae]|uniref:GPI inositol-deacylase n=1 Tax=Tropilaelaps mercedesae TaxID=418985 RepID=A0A1V9XF17_9ACAR|nr:GPI inositol-deacylase-like [Tropilaelaps mercedesae]
MSVPSNVLVGSFAVLSALVSLRQLLDLPANHCSMTYMPIPPQYIEVEMTENVTKRFPRYRLLLYGEGVVARDLRRFGPRGIPLVFIHGNAGNPGQARAIGSILQLKAEMRNMLDSPVYSVYTVDFDEELSALYGGVLPQQAEFLQECLRVVCQKWNSSHPDQPPRIIFVGHSMGGVVARSLYLQPDFDISLVGLHVELASPSQRPVAYLDRGLWEFYERINQVWSQVGHVLPPVLSIMGGERDLQVRANLGGSPQNLRVLSESVPQCWASSDHLCVVWCKQLQLALSRALLDIVHNGSIIEDRDRIIRVLNYHFVRKFAFHNSLQTLPRLPRSVDFAQGREWQEMFEGSWRYMRKKVITGISLVVPVYKELSVTLVAYGLENDDWLFGCTRMKREGSVVSCLSGVDISRKNLLVPSLIKRQEAMFESTGRGTGRVYHISPEEISARNFQSLVIAVPALMEDVVILGERFISRKRETTFDATALFNGFFQKKTVLSMHLSEKAIYQKLTLAGMQHLWQVYTIKVHSKLCMDGTTGASFASFKPDWSKEEQFFRIRARPNAITKFTLRLHSAPGHRENHNSTLSFYFDPGCSYDVHLQFDLKTSLAQLLVHHAEGLFSYCLALVLVVIARQMVDLGQLGICFTFGDSLSRSSRFFALTLLPALIEAMTFLPTPPAPLAPYLSRPPSTTSTTEGYVVRILLYALALGLISLLAKTLELVLDLCSAIYIRTKKCMRQSWDDPRTMPQLNENATSRTLTATLVAVLGLTVGVGGGVGLTAAICVHCIQVIVLSCQNRFLEDRKGASAFSSRWKLQTSLLLVQLLCLPLYLPSLAIWIRQQFTPLANDPYLFSAPICVFFATVVTQPNVPHPNRYYYKSTGYCIYILAILSVLVCREAIFRMSYIQLIVFALLFFQQNFKP